MHHKGQRVFTAGQLGTHFGVPYWQVDALWRRGLLPEAERVGSYRVVPECDLPKVEAALRRGGYLKEESASV
jgi:hypothetical protein